MDRIQNERTLERMNQYRDGNGVTLRFLAKQFQLHYNTLSKWRSGNVYLKLETLRRINDWLDSKER